MSTQTNRSNSQQNQQSRTDFPDDRFVALSLGIKKYHGPACPIDGTTLRSAVHDACIACFCRTQKEAREEHEARAQRELEEARKSQSLSRGTQKKIAKAEWERRSADRKKAEQRLAKHQMRVAAVAEYEAALKAVEAGEIPKPPSVIQRAQLDAQTYEGERCPIDGTTQKYTHLHGRGNCVHCYVISSWAGQVRKWNAQGDIFVKPGN